MKRSKVTVKALGLVVSDKKIFENCILKTYFDPLTYLCNQSEPFERFWYGTSTLCSGELKIGLVFNHQLRKYIYICINILITSTSVYTTSDVIKAQKGYGIYIQKQVTLRHSLDGLKTY